MRMNAVIFSLLCVLVFPRASTGSWNLGPKLQVAKGGYPRALRLQNDGKWLACAGVSEGTGMPKVLRVYTAASPGGPWSILSTVIEASGAVDLANCFLYELPRNGTLLAAFRLHSGIMANGTAASYSLQTRRSFDGGKSWSASSVGASSLSFHGEDARGPRHTNTSPPPLPPRPHPHTSQKSTPALCMAPGNPFCMHEGRRCTASLPSSSHHTGKASLTLNKISLVLCLQTEEPRGARPLRAR